MVQHRKTWVFLLLVIILTLAVTGCGSSEPATASVRMAPFDSMPTEVQNAPVTVHQAYQFAVANPEVLTAIPCYCGCGSMGHTSNYACYVSGIDEKGNVLFDSHALGCSICVDITQDTMRMLQQGKTVSEIRDYVDQTYAQYGPSNMP